MVSGEIKMCESKYFWLLVNAKCSGTSNYHIFRVCCDVFRVRDIHTAFLQLFSLVSHNSLLELHGLVPADYHFETTSSKSMITLKLWRYRKTLVYFFRFSIAILLVFILNQIITYHAKENRFSDNVFNQFSDRCSCWRILVILVESSEIFKCVDMLFLR